MFGLNLDTGLYHSSKKRNKSKAGMMLVALSAVSLMLAGCSSSRVYDDGVYDPMEGMNRTTFKINNAMDSVIAEPIAKGYRAAVPTPARKGVSNFLQNLKSPVNFANQLLQGDVEGAGNVLFRTTVNTLIGVGGLFDVAGAEGYKHEDEDFGQTLAVWGVGHGPYLVLPFFGPSSLRDATGMFVDSYADPLRLYLFNTDQENWHYARVAAESISRREELLDVLADLEMNSIDYYAALRSAYYQRREAMVNDQDGSYNAGPSIPYYDDFDDSADW